MVRRLMISLPITPVYVSAIRQLWLLPCAPQLMGSGQDCEYRVGHLQPPPKVSHDPKGKELIRSYYIELQGTPRVDIQRQSTPRKQG